MATGQIYRRLTSSAVATMVAIATLCVSAEPAAAAPSTPLEKVRALEKVEILAEPVLLQMTDCTFVTAVWQRIEKKPFLDEVRTAARHAFSGTLAVAGDVTECTAFIRTGIHEAKARDVAIEVRVKDERLTEREMKSRAAQIIGVVADETLLALTVKEFVRALHERAAGPRVKAAAHAAYTGNDQDRLHFLTTGVAQAHEADYRAAIEARTDLDKKEKERLIEKAARESAGSVLLIEVTPGMLNASDWDFVNQLWVRARQHSEIKTDALRALENPNPAAVRSFIHEGIHAASRRDFTIAVERKRQADRTEAEQILLQSTRDGYHNLAHAARKALDGTPDTIEAFLRTGQHDLDLATGFEPGDVPPTWLDTPDSVANIGGFCCGRTGPELTVGDGISRDEGNHSLLYSGRDNSAQTSFAYVKVMKLDRIKIKPTTTLTYWIAPEQFGREHNQVGAPVDNSSMCVAVDLTFSDGRNLRDSGATDQRGRRVHPAHQCGSMNPRLWNKVTVKLDRFANSHVTTLLVGFDQPADTGRYRGYIDNITITD